MYNTLKNDQRTLKLPYLCMQLLKRLDFSLTALERIIFLRFLLRYGLNKTSKKDLETVAEKIGIRLPTLKKTIAVFLEKGVLCDVGDGHFRISTRLLKLVLATSKARRTYSKFVRFNYKVERPKVDFLIQLFHLLFRIRISHKQKNVHQLLQLNYQQWLVLLNMVWRSDRYGVVFEASTHELANHTGMSRAALLRAITGLFEFGILRTKINGSLNHNLLRSVSAVYFLNLSHPIWGDSRIYADYYILRFPKEYRSVTQQVFRAIQSWLDPNQATGDSTQSDIGINVLQYNDRAQIYQLKAYPLIEQLAPQFSLGVALDPKFAQYLSLLSPDFKYAEGRLNQLEDNLQRMNLLLQRYWQQRQLNAQQIVHPAVILPNDKLSRWFGSYLRPIQLSSEAQVQAKQKQMNPVHLLDALEYMRNQFLFEVAQLVFQSELFPALQWMLAAPSAQDKPQRDLQPLQFAMLGSGLAQQQIYSQLKPRQQQDRFFLLEFIGLKGSAEDYEIQCQTLELGEDQQQSYGLLDPRFKSFAIQEEHATDLADSD